MKKKYIFPQDLQKLKDNVMEYIKPIAEVQDEDIIPYNFFWLLKRTNAGRDLPEYYLVYYLLVELLGFEDNGKREKVSWSVLIKFNNNIYAVEHWKMGLGLFAIEPDKAEKEGRQIVKLIKKAIKYVTPYYQWLAQEAIKTSDLNIKNYCNQLFCRYEYFVANVNKITKLLIKEEDKTLKKNYHKLNKLKQEKKWMSLAAIESFFSWTEHVFIHLSVLLGKNTTGEEVLKMINECYWKEKFKRVIDINSDPNIKKIFDKLCIIKEQIRNFYAHGAFGKFGQAFDFHSNIGAIPIYLPNKGDKMLSIMGHPTFDEDEAIFTINLFLDMFWSSGREIARDYLHSTYLPTILSYARNGIYEQAMNSKEDMHEFISYLEEIFDNSANMDWW